MATATIEPSSASEASPPATRDARSRERWWIPAVVMAAQLPLLAVHLRNLWQRTHYQFYPLLLLAVAWLLWQRMPRSRTASGSGSRLENALVLGGFVLLLAAFVFFVPWLAALAALLTAGGVLRRYSGPDGWRQVWPVWALAWIILPPPFGIDRRLVHILQQFTAWCSSTTLDLLSVTHLMEGTVLRFPDRTLLVEEACSGIQSLFTILAYTLVFVVYKGRGWFTSAMLLGFAVVWALLANILRVLTIALAHHSLGVDLASGWRHEFLGLAVLALALGLLASADALVFFFCGPILGVPERGFLKTLTRIWNRFIAGFAGEPRKRQAGRVPTTESLAGEESPRRRRPRWSALASPAFGVVLGVAGALQLLTITVAEPEWGSEKAASQQRLLNRIASEFNEDFFAASQSGWKLKRFYREERERDSSFGRFSSIWEFETPSGPVTLSLDYPFDEFHPLMDCYRSQGWRLGPVVSSPATRSFDFQLSKPTGEHGLVCFSLFNRDTLPVEPARIGLAESVRSRLTHSPVVWLLGRKLTRLDPSAYQFQVFTVSDSPISSSDRDELRQRYYALRTRVIQHWREAVAPR